MWEKLPWAITRAALLALLVSGLWHPRPDAAVSPTHICFGERCERIIQKAPNTTQMPRLAPETPAPTKPTIS